MKAPYVWKLHIPMNMLIFWWFHGGFHDLFGYIFHETTMKNVQNPHPGVDPLLRQCCFGAFGHLEPPRCAFDGGGKWTLGDGENGGKKLEKWWKMMDHPLKKWWNMVIGKMLGNWIRIPPTWDWMKSYCLDDFHDQIWNFIWIEIR